MIKIDKNTRNATKILTKLRYIITKSYCFKARSYVPKIYISYNT